MENNVLIIDFGSQYTQLIARRVRELNIYSEIHPFNKIPSDLNRFKAIILSGSPFSVRDENAPKIDLDTLINTKPVSTLTLEKLNLELSFIALRNNFPSTKAVSR